MKAARWILGLTGVVVMSLALACEPGKPPTAPALSKTAVAADKILPDGPGSAEVTFTTVDPPGAIYSEVNDINARGQMVGRYHDGPTCSLTPTVCNAPDGHTHGFLLSDGVFTTIDPPGSIQTGAVGISPHGDVVGFYQTAADAIAHGFLLSDGAFISYDFPAATFTRGQGMNAQSDIVGEYHLPDNTVHGFLLREGAFTAIDVPDAVATSAWRINAAGEIVGRYRSPDGMEHVFLLSGDQFTSVDFPGAFSTAPARIPFVGINARGDIVGTHCDAACTALSNGRVHGFLLTGGAFTSFDFPGASLTAAAAINDRGVIVGAYKDRPTTPGCTVSPRCAQVHGYLRSR